MPDLLPHTKVVGCTKIQNLSFQVIDAGDNCHIIGLRIFFFPYQMTHVQWVPGRWRCGTLILGGGGAAAYRNDDSRQTARHPTSEMGDRVDRIARDKHAANPQ